MRPVTRHIALVGAGLAAVLVLGACGNGDSGGSMGGMSHGSSTSATTGTTDGQAQDVMFAQMMLPHHQQAVEMADLAVKSSQSADVTDLARQIKAAQGPEIRTMTQWLRDWGAASPPSMGHGAEGGGMMSEEDIKALAFSQGSTFDRMWLTMMIEHHEGAVEMAQDVLKTTANTEVKGVAQAIVDGQKKEIATMKALL